MCTGLRIQASVNRVELCYGVVHQYTTSYTQVIAE